MIGRSSRSGVMSHPDQVPVTLRVATKASTMSLWKLFWFLIFPGAFLLGGAYLLQNAGIVSPARTGVVEFYLPVVLVSGLLLGWRFRRSRLILALAVLALTARGMTGLPAGTHQAFIFQAGAMLVPLNLLLVVYYRERGLWSPVGILRLMLLPAQILALFALHIAFGSNLIGPLTRLWLPLKELTGLSLAQPALAVYLIAAIVSIWRFLIKPSAFEGAFPWAMGASLMAFLNPPEAGFWLATGGLALCIALVESLFAMAYDDELTGLPARRPLNEHLARLGGLFTVAMIDVDFFKKVNDRHGHEVGDQVLKMVAGRLRLASGGGKAYRYGGEEFCLVFSGKDLDEVRPHLEELRKRIGQSEFLLRDAHHRPKEKPKNPAHPRDGKGLRVTVSIGAADRTEARKKPGDVLKAADKALYKAKKSGRNRVCPA